MRIKEVELVGFKSFVDKTRLTFDEGISGVVGPNGCGKSNIVDAIRWTMGEMSAKSLRGSEMQDVIFSGTETRKPMGMAQVSIVFSCEDGVYPTGYQGMAEIQVTRRLYRSGESEYLLNRRPCRLKDIIDLFLDTGVGSRAYSIIEQGQINRIISSKPLDRRILIEEAAGISKYRVKREEANRKIEATRTNLNRVNDVLFEIKRNLNSLNRQASKARRYHEFKAELKELDFELSAREKKHLANEQRRLEADLTRLRDMRQQAGLKLDADETRLTTLRLEVLEHEKAINAAVEKVNVVRETVRAEESRREILTHDIDALEEQITVWREEIETARARIAAYDAEVVAAAEEIAGLDEKIAAAQEVLAEHQKKLDGTQTRRAELDQSAEGARNQLLSLAGRHASLERALQGHEETVASHRQRLEGTTRRQMQIDERLVAAGDEADTLRQHVAELQAERARLEENAAEKRGRLDDITATSDARRRAYEGAKEAYEKSRVRLESLEQMRRNLEGYQYGVRKIMEAARSRDGGLNGGSEAIVGVLAEKVEIGRRFETALEAVLGERLQAVLVTNQDAGAAAVDFLKSRDAGRSSFVPLQPRLMPAYYPEATVSQTLGPLSAQVRVAPEYQQVTDALLTNVLVVEDLPTAVKLHKKNGYTGAFVTLDGEIVDSAGTITGGQVDAVTTGILQKKREIAELTEQVARLEDEFTKAKDEHFKAEGLAARLKDVIAQVKKSLDDNRIALAETTGELRRVEQEKTRLRTTSDELAAESRQLTERLDALARRHESEKADFAEVDAALSAARHAADDKTAAQRALASEIDGVQRAVREALVIVNDLRQRQTNAAARRDSRIQAKEEAANLVTHRLGQVEQARSRQNEHREKIGQFTEALGETMEKLDEAEAEAVRVREGVDEQMAAAEQGESALKMLRRDIDGYEKEIHAAELTGAEVKMRREHVAERLREKYEIELDDLAEPADEAEIDTEALRTRAREINQRVVQMGEVNPNAVEEFNEQQERFDHFESQKADLEESIDELRRAIAKINKTSKQRFEETFNLVNHKFSQVLPRLFGGGSARLVMLEPDKPLETGIDIIVRPPGKKLTNISLLSGGEKALSSIGLIFSIFLIKPSPFCLLDEVDAPLDDANVYRFNELVNEMASHSQVIIITHNKATMEVVDSLFGVTMQEKGVSKVVGVEMIKDELAAN